ncbi:MAG TPA: adenylyl-sulfate kinase, partial [Thermodesulfovibrionales bacterium]|nr:adenylyl-sulfate kinase [Thermodesulfovibrionales bacterium]
MNPLALWITGLPGSGKSTIADEIKRLHPDFIILRMDTLRKVVTPEPTYSDSEREIVYRCLVYTASVLTDHGHTVLIDATGNMRKWRDLARRTIAGYAEIYLQCPLELCIERERHRSGTREAPREIYQKAGDWPVPGISVPYEEPPHPELLIPTDRTSIAEAVKLIENLMWRL